MELRAVPKVDSASCAIAMPGSSLAAVVPVTFSVGVSALVVVTIVVDGMVVLPSSAAVYAESYVILFSGAWTMYSHPSLSNARSNPYSLSISSICRCYANIISNSICISPLRTYFSQTKTSMML